MADFEAFYHFASDADPFAQNLVKSLGVAGDAVKRFTAQVAGTSVPLDLESQLFRAIGNAQVQTRRAMAEMLDPTKLGHVPNTREIMETSRQAVLGSFTQAKLEIDRIMGQLGPDAREALVNSGQLPRLIGAMGETLIKDAGTAYKDVWRQFDTSIQQQLPDRLPRQYKSQLTKQLGKVEEVPGPVPGSVDLNPVGLIGDAAVQLENAQAKRLAKMYDEVVTGQDADGKDMKSLELNAAKYVEEEQKALAERVRVSTTSTVFSINEDRARLAEALALLVRQPSTNKYAEALGVTLHPETGMPVVRSGAGAMEEPNPWRAQQLLQQIDELQRRDLETQALLNSNVIRPIKGGRGGATPYLVDTRTEASPKPTFFGWETKGGFQILRQLDETEGKIRDVTRASEAWHKEQKAIAAAVAAANAAGSQAQLQQQQQVLGVAPGFMRGLFGSNYGSLAGGLNAEQIRTNLATTAGSAVRYSLAYGGFYELTRAMRDGLAIFMDYQDSFTDYQVAVGDAGQVTQQTTNDLMDLSRVLGENVGAAYDAAARGVRAFASDASEADKQMAGFATASAAQKVSVIANKSLTDATGDVIAVGSAYGLNAVQTELLLPDALSNAKRNIGGDPTQISQGLANFAVTAKEAGYSLQEAADLIALIQSRTDESGQAVSTRLSRIIQIVSGTTGRGLAQQVNRTLGAAMIDVNALPKEQLQQFARAYIEAGKEGLTGLQGIIRSQLGGTSNLKELMPLLDASGQKQLADALKKATAGAGDAEYQRKLNNLIGTLNKIKGSIQNIVVLAANSDIFAPFGIAVKTLEVVLHTLERILKVYQSIEGVLGPVGPLITTGAEVGLGVLGFKALQRSAFMNTVAGGNGLTAAAAQTLIGQTAANKQVTASATMAARALVRLGLAADEAAAQQMISRFWQDANIVRGLEGPLAVKPLLPGGNITAGIALASVIAAAIETHDKVKQDQQFKSREAYLLKNSGTTSTDITNTADSLNTLSANARHEGGWFSAMQSLFGGGTADFAAEHANALRGIAAQVAAEENLAKARQHSTIFGESASRTTDSLAQAMQSLTEQGDTAGMKLHAYFKALMTPDPDQLGAAEQPKKYAAYLLQNLSRAVYQAAGDESSYNHYPGSGFLHNVTGTSYLADQKSHEGTRSALMEQFMTSKAYKSLLASIRNAGPNLDFNTVMDAYNKAFDAAFGANNPHGTDEFAWGGMLDKGQFRKNMLARLKNYADVWQHMVSTLKPLTYAELQTLLQAQDDYVSAANPDDGGLQATRRKIEVWKEMILRRAAAKAAADAALVAEAARADVPPPGIAAPNFSPVPPIILNGGETPQGELQATAKAERIRHKQAAEAMVAQAEDLRAAILSHNQTASQDERQALNIKYAKISLRKAGNYIGLIEQIFESNDMVTVKALIQSRQTALDVAKLALKDAEAQMTIVDQMMANSPLSFLDPAAAKYLKLKKKVAAAIKALDAVHTAFKHSTIGNADIGSSDSSTPKDTAEEIAAAKLGAWAAQHRGGINEARAALAAAKAALDKEKYGTKAYWDAMAAYHQAQWQLNDAVLAYKTTLDQLHGDLTDPVEQARDATREAARKLREDIAGGAGKDTIAADKLDLKQKQTAEEAAKFQQRFSDMQTADNLGRISHQKYMAYLDHEHDRLTAIKHRTRQQQDELDQIDGAMKDAVNAMQGQFNIGDINVNGLVYQARRYAADRKAEMDASNNANAAARLGSVAYNQDIKIFIDGADTAKVRKIVEHYVAHAGRTRTTQPRRR